MVIIKSGQGLGPDLRGLREISGQGLGPGILGGGEISGQGKILENVLEPEKVQFQKDSGKVSEKFLKMFWKILGNVLENVWKIFRNNC